jgi:transcriptional regulator with XRE-family HTH domain
VASATLATAFKALRESRGITQNDTALQAGFCEAVSWKVENSRSVRWETVHTMLTVSLRCQPGTPSYENIHRLWMKFREGMAERAPATKGKHKVTPMERRATSAFRELLRGRDDASVRKIIAAAARTAAKLDGVPSKVIASRKAK